MYRYFLLINLFIVVCIVPLIGQYTDEIYQRHWQIADTTTIEWDLNHTQNLPHSDNIEMSGKRVAGIITYEIDTNGVLSLNRQIFFPQLHPFIKDNVPSWHIYRAYLKDTYSDDILPQLFIANQQFVPGVLKKMYLNGNLNFSHYPSSTGLALERTLFPSTNQGLFLEQWTLTNTTDSTINIKTANTFIQKESYGKDGKFVQTVQSDALEEITLAAQQSLQFSIQMTGRLASELLTQGNHQLELQQRNDFLKTLANHLILETPNKSLNTLFQFSKIRATESIFESKLGLIHSPGGGRYYVGIWANDQAEYVSPFFPYLGHDMGNESALNCYRAFAKEINDDYEKIRYAFEIEGTVPPFLLDRGDAAMIAYGASQFVLANGEHEVAAELWPLIAWCLEYCHRQLNAEGVVKSESDEMEGRIETGTANLATSALYYGALNLALDLGEILKQPNKVLKQYEKQAKDLRQAIEKYFGATVEGLDTYKYYDSHKHLRHWICLPLVVGIFDRKEETIAALFDRLWTENGVHVEKNSENEAISNIFWDRGTLYALRGTFLAGATEVSLEKLIVYSNERLLGKRVPYPVEAYPEGNMAHLSAESGLYCRIFTEGLFGIVPTGLNSFSCTPRLPDNWDTMSLKKVKAFGNDFDILISKKEKDNIQVRVFSHQKNALILKKIIQNGDDVEVIF